MAWSAEEATSIVEGGLGGGLHVEGILCQNWVDEFTN